MPLHPWSQGPEQEQAAMMTQFPKWPRCGARAAFWGPMDPGGPYCSPGSPTPGPGSWLRAAAWQPRAGGGRRVVWGFSLPEGPSLLCAEQTFRPDVGNMRNQFARELSSQTSHLWRGRQDPCCPPGGSGVSCLGNQRPSYVEAQG